MSWDMVKKIEDRKDEARLRIVEFTDVVVKCQEVLQKLEDLDQLTYNNADNVTVARENIEELMNSALRMKAKWEGVFNGGAK